MGSSDHDLSSAKNTYIGIHSLAAAICHFRTFALTTCLTCINYPLGKGNPATLLLFSSKHESIIFD